MTKSAKTPGLVRQQIASLSPSQRNILLFAGMGLLLIIVGIVQSWNVAFSILNMCLISAIMALGVNIQWGYAGLFNVGIMGFAALGGLAAVVVSMPPVEAAWAAGGLGVVAGLAIGIVTLLVSMLIWRRGQGWGRWRYAVTGGVVVAGNGGGSGDGDDDDDDDVDADDDDDDTDDDDDEDDDDES